MTQIRKAAFVVNPISGGKSKQPVMDILKRNMPPGLLPEFIVWERPEDIGAIKDRLREGGYDLAVAVGGDGTINQMAQAVAGTATVLGIIPGGSGNGLARHLHIPLRATDALRVLGEGQAIRMDCGSINGKLFCCTAGVGFDAHVGSAFAENKGRGFLTYAKATIEQLLVFRPSTYRLILDGQEMVRRAYTITFANGSQYGNNAVIAPQADVQDGILNVCVVRPFKAWHAPRLAYQLLNNGMANSPFYEAYQARRIELIREKPGPVHFDGEPAIMDEKIEVRALPSHISVMVPQGYKNQLGKNLV